MQGAHIQVYGIRLAAREVLKAARYFDSAEPFCGEDAINQ
jgi:hypothetical protein